MGLALVGGTLAAAANSSHTELVVVASAALLVFLWRVELVSVAAPHRGPNAAQDGVASPAGRAWSELGGLPLVLY